MPLPTDIVRSLIGALDEPAMLVEGTRTLAANAAARGLLGQRIEGADVRIAIRHPEALAAIGSRQDHDLELAGIAGADRPWLLTVRQIEPGVSLVRLVDRSAGRATPRHSPKRVRSIGTRGATSARSFMARPSACFGSSRT